MKNFAFVWLAILALSVSMIACGKKKSSATTPVNPLTVSCATCFASGALLAKAGGSNSSMRLELDLFGDPKIPPPAGFLSTDPEPLRWYGLYGAVPISATGILTMFGSGMGMNTCGVLPGPFTVRPLTVGSFEQRSINGLVLEAISQIDGRVLTLRLDNVWLVSVSGGPASRTTSNILAAANGYGSGALILETVYGQPCNQALLLY